jgi:hypothetical protein
MKLIKTGKYTEPFSLKWNECIFVDIWNNYNLHSDCRGTTFDYRLKEYLQSKKLSIDYFNQNYIKLINKGE